MSQSQRIQDMTAAQAKRQAAELAKASRRGAGAGVVDRGALLQYIAAIRCSRRRCAKSSKLQHPPLPGGCVNTAPTSPTATLGMQAVAAAEREGRAADGRLAQLEADLMAAQVQLPSREICWCGADALMALIFAFCSLLLVGAAAGAGKTALQPATRSPAPTAFCCRCRRARWLRRASSARRCRRSTRG